MDLLALAVPFFVLALLIELTVDWLRGTHYFRSADAINSISAGALSTTLGYFTKLLPAAIMAYVLRDYALFDLSMDDFDLSGRGLLNWAIALLAFDFSYYWAHRFGHEISVLWAAHSVHHQSEDYNLSTALRQTSTSFLFGWIFYLPLFLFGMPFEVYATVNALDLIYQFWVHTRHIKRLGYFDSVFVTPSNHRVHHAQNEIYIDRNYGGIFILWDRLFGTFQPELDDQPVVFGVRKPLQSWNPFWANLQVYNYLWFDAVRTRRWRDKLGLWFRRTGWRPDDVSAEYPKPATDLSAFEKYDPDVGTGIKRYAVAQFSIAVVFIVLIGQIYANSGASAALLPCVLLWLQLYSLGSLNEGKPYADKLELLRLLVVTPGVVFYLWEYGTVAGLTTNVLIFVSAYCVISALSLLFINKKKSEKQYIIQ